MSITGSTEVPANVAPLKVKSEVEKLQMFEPAIGIYPDFVQETPTALVINEHFTWGDANFTVKDVMGTIILHCKKFPVSLHHSIVVSPPDDRPLFTLSDKALALTKTFIGRDAEDESHKALFQIHRHHLFDDKIQVTFTNASTGKLASLLVDDEFWSGNANITFQDQPVALVRMGELRAQQLYTNHHALVVTVAAGVDVALIAAICICLDGMKNESCTGWHPQYSPALIPPLM